MTVIECDNCARLRRQNHEYAERRDQELAELRSQVAKYRKASERARELVRGSPVDWSKDPRSQGPDGWWNYTSQVNREILIAAVLALDSSAVTTSVTVNDVA